MSASPLVAISTAALVAVVAAGAWRRWSSPARRPTVVDHHEPIDPPAAPRPVLPEPIPHGAVVRRPWRRRPFRPHRHRRHRPDRLAGHHSRNRTVAMVLVSFATLLVSLLAGLTIGWLPLALALTAGGGCRRSRRIVDQRRRRRRIELAIPTMIEQFVLTVGAGMTVRQTVRLLAARSSRAVRPAFAAVVHRMDRGVPLADALGALVETLGPCATPMVDAIIPAERYGQPLAAVLEQLALEARHTRRRLDEADARRLPVRLTAPLVTCTLPAFVLLSIGPVALSALRSLGENAW